MARFGGGANKGAFAGLGEASTTIEAMALMEEQRQKKLQRAERFGIVTKEISEQRIKQRQERFGIETKESVDAKKQERMKRFGSMMEGATSNMTAEELDAKRKARLERFGAEAVEEAEKTAGDGWKDNRRKQKQQHKRTLFGGDKHKGKFNKNKRFRK